MCGIAGVIGVEGASRYVLAALRAVQPRGTFSAGLAARNNGGQIICETGLGMVDHVFPDMHIDRPYPTIACIGHVRYATRGGRTLACAQPFVVGDVVHCGNGDLPNYEELRIEAERQGCELQTRSDGELIAALLNAEWQRSHLVEKALRNVMERAEGAYSSLAYIGPYVVAFRDPWGFRPMEYGKLHNGWIVASETEALVSVGAQVQESVQCGEAIIFYPSERFFISPKRIRIVPPKSPAHCFFEKTYFAFPSSTMFGEEVAAFRLRVGHCLAREECMELSKDVIVMSVPDSGNLYADGYAEISGRRRVQGLVRRHHKQRTFILPEGHEAAVDAKFAFYDSILNGANIVLCDDSIVRGSTMRRLIHRLRQHGVANIHVRIGCPPVMDSCYFGIDTPTQTELIAYQYASDTTRICEVIGADSLQYLSLEGLRTCLHESKNHCMACVTGEYPIAKPSQREVLLSTEHP